MEKKKENKKNISIEEKILFTEETERSISEYDETLTLKQNIRNAKREDKLFNRTLLLIISLFLCFGLICGGVILYKDFKEINNNLNENLNKCVESNSELINQNKGLNEKVELYSDSIEYYKEYYDFNRTRYQEKNTFYFSPITSAYR